MMQTSSMLVAAPQAGGGTSPGLVLMIQLIAIVAIFWFLLIRPQRKAAQRHRELLDSLKRGDEVVTEGGLIGEIVHLKDDRITIKTGDTRVVVARPKIARVLGHTGSDAQA